MPVKVNALPAVGDIHVQPDPLLKRQVLIMFCFDAVIDRSSVSFGSKPTSLSINVQYSSRIYHLIVTIVFTCWKEFLILNYTLANQREKSYEQLNARKLRYNKQRISTEERYRLFYHLMFARSMFGRWQRRKPYFIIC